MLRLSSENQLGGSPIMRRLSVFCQLTVLFVVAPLPARAQYTVREAGFVEPEPRPYRLLHLTENENAPATKTQHADLRVKTKHSNIVLVTLPPDRKKVASTLKNVSMPDNLARSEFWLIAPDDRMIPFDPSGSLTLLLRSPMRLQIRGEIADALCTVLLLESTDEQANKKARAKVSRVLSAFNKSKAKLDDSLHSDVKLLTITDKMREQERWTLWGLGEEQAPTESPKVVVLFGNMLRAGESFDGAEWAERDLLERIATLTLQCQNTPTMRELFGPALPFGMEKNWLGDMKDALKFDPRSKEARLKLADLWSKAKPEVDDKTPRKLAFTRLIDEFQEVEPENGAGDPNDPNRPEDNNIVALPIPEQADPSKSFFASTTLGVILFSIGIVGWIALAGVTWMIERGRASAKTPTPAG